MKNLYIEDEVIFETGGEYEISVNGEVVGDPFHVNRIRSLRFKDFSSISGGSYSVFVDENVMGYQYDLGFVNQLKLTYSSVVGGAYNMIVDNTITGNKIFLTHTNTAYILRDIIVGGVHTVSVNGESCRRSFYNNTY